MENMKSQSSDTYRNLFEFKTNGSKKTISKSQTPKNKLTNKNQNDIIDVNQDSFKTNRPLLSRPHLNNEFQNLFELINGLHESQKQITKFFHEISLGSEEGDVMSDEIKEIKVKVHDIDKAVQTLNTNVAVLENTVKLRFDTVDSTLKEIKETLKDSVTSKRWKVTTSITVVGSIISLLSLIAVVIKIFKP